MKNKAKNEEDDLRPEYNFDYSKGIPGKNLKKFSKWEKHLVLLEPDVAKFFKSSGEVNDALRALLDLSRSTPFLNRQRSPRKAKGA